MLLMFVCSGVSYTGSKVTKERKQNVIGKVSGFTSLRGNGTLVLFSNGLVELVSHGKNQDHACC